MTEMGNVEEIAGQVVQPLSKTAANVVKDAFALVVAAEEQYDESTVAIEELEFASFAVAGLAAAAVTPQPGAVRSSSRVEIPLSDSAGGHATAGQTVTLFGPGDVRGIDPAQVVRRYPAPGTTTAEETVLAHIEFDRPELPWAFSAAPPQGALRPWLTLIVVERPSAEWEPGTGLLPVLRVPLDELPPLASAHLWAHAQAPQTENAASMAVRLSPEYATVNLSRVVSPRVLRQDTDYLAAVVPTTDVGARAGLGLTGGTLGPAWTSASEDPVRLPVYDSWEFRTGPDGDFATLALRLDGVVAPYEVGRRRIDATEPGKPLPPLPEGSPGAKQVLRCALYSPSPPPTPEDEAAETAAWPDEMTDHLRDALDRPAELEGAQERTDDIDDLPVLGPRIYAQLHRGSPVITGQDWFAELNLSPTRRVVAGLGTRVVQRDQEQLMQAAWAQLGEVQKANRAIQLAQLAELLAERLHERLGDLSQGHLLQVAAPLATRVSLGADRTLAAEVASSATPVTAVSGAFRRSTRPGGPVVRRAAADTRRRAGELVGLDTLRDFTRVYQNPDGIGSLSQAAIAGLDTALVARVIDVPVAKVPDALSRASESLPSGLATTLTEPSRWEAPRADFDPGRGMVERWSRHLLDEATVPALQTIRAQRVGPLAAELAVAGSIARPEVRERLEGHALELNNQLVTRLSRVTEDDVVVRRFPGRGRGIGTARTGRVAVRGVRGLNRLDPTELRRTTVRSRPEARIEALRRLADVAEVRLAPVVDSVRQLPVERLRAQLPTLVDPGGLLSIDKVTRRETLTVEALAGVLEPSRTIRAALNGRLQLAGVVGAHWFGKPLITPIKAAPRFDRPMYQALNDYSRDWLVPGLGLLPDSDFVTVLSTNSEFMEAFLVGLSDEMGRELLWRNYPTDQRGTYFHRFWDARQDELTEPIHAFSHTPLASHVSVGGTGGSGPRAVIVVKSELVRRYPDATIQVIRNQGTDADPEFEKEGSPQQVADQLFAAHLEPDVSLVGVDLGIDELDRPEWWIVIAEHPSATRFDRPRDDQMPAGERFLTVPAAAHGAAFAAERLHDPVRVAFRASDLIVREN